jgi:hypothetical protein
MCRASWKRLATLVAAAVPIMNIFVLLLLLLLLLCCVLQ